MTAPSNKTPFLRGFVAGSLTGLGLALGVALLIAFNNPFLDKASSKKILQTQNQTTPAEAPRYEFNKADNVNAGNEPPTADPLAASQPDNGGYFLQAGAFSQAADADQMKARLALLGIEANIALTADQETPLSKVQIGPYKALDELNSVRARLTQNGIDTILVKVPPQPTTQPATQPQETP